MITPSSTTVSASALLERMLTIPSVTGGEGPLVTALSGELAGLGFSTSIDSAGSLVATWGDGTTDVLLVGHIDTVPGDIPVRHDAGRLYGRGSVDAKGPLAAALAAVSRQPRHGPHRYTVVAAVDEEGASRGARALLTRTSPDHLIVLEPSGWDSITIGYRGCVRADVRISSPVAHGASGRQSAADTAVVFLATLRAEVEAHRDVQREVDRPALRIDSMNSNSDGISDSCDIKLSVRIPLTVTEAEAQQWLDAATHAAMADESAAVVRCEVRWSCAAARASKNSALCRALVRAIRDHGGSPRFTTKTGTADLNVLLPHWNCPAVVYGPGDSHLDHTPHESIELAELERSTDILSAALEAL